MLAHPFSLVVPQVVEESTTWTPLIFVLSPGVDPTGALLQLAEASGMSAYFHALSLGHGQAPFAKTMIEEGIKKGTTHLRTVFSICWLALFIFSRAAVLKKNKKIGHRQVKFRSHLGQI